MAFSQRWLISLLCLSALLDTGRAYAETLSVDDMSGRRNQAQTWTKLDDYLSLPSAEEQGRAAGGSVQQKTAPPATDAEVSETPHINPPVMPNVMPAKQEEEDDEEDDDGVHELAGMLDPQGWQDAKEAAKTWEQNKQEVPLSLGQLPSLRPDQETITLDSVIAPKRAPAPPTSLAASAGVEKKVVVGSCSPAKEDSVLARYQTAMERDRKTLDALRAAVKDLKLEKELDFLPLKESGPTVVEPNTPPKPLS